MNAGALAGIGNPAAADFCARRLGELRMGTFAGPPLLVDPDRSHWLRTGNLIPYSSQYASLLADQSGLAVYSMSPVSGYSAASYQASSGTKFFSGIKGRNWQVGGDANNSYNWIDVRNSAGTLTFNTTTISITQYMSNMKGAMSMASSDTLFVFGRRDTTEAYTGAVYFDSATTAANAAGLGFGVDIWAGAASPTLGVCVAGFNNAPLANSSGLYTSTNLQSWTIRTGTGGTNARIRSMHYSPAGSCFLYVVGEVGGVGALNRTTDGFTQTACTLPSGTSLVVGDSWERRFAASPTASLFLLSDARILRTTDGTNFSIVDPYASGKLSVPSLGSSLSIIFYDSTASRFVISTDSLRRATPFFYFSEDDGLTWRASTNFDNFSLTDATLKPAGFGVVNASGNKFVMALGNYEGGGGSVHSIYDLTNAGMLNPTHVGTYTAAQLSIGAGLLPAPLYARIK